MRREEPAYPSAPRICPRNRGIDRMNDVGTGVSAARVGSAALSLASSGALMILLKASHPPAGATTLIISLGIVTRPFHLAVIEIAVLRADLSGELHG